MVTYRPSLYHTCFYCGKLFKKPNRVSWSTWKEKHKCYSCVAKKNTQRVEPKKYTLEDMNTNHQLYEDNFRKLFKAKGKRRTKLLNLEKFLHKKSELIIASLMAQKLINRYEPKKVME